MATGYTIRIEGQDMDDLTLERRYPGLCSIKLHHGGYFTKPPRREYINGCVSFVDGIDIDKFSVLEIDDIVEKLGYHVNNPKHYAFLMPDTNLDYGLSDLCNDSDFNNMRVYFELHKTISVYMTSGVEGNGPSDVMNTQSSVVIDKVYDAIDLQDDINDSDFDEDEVNNISDVDVDMKEFEFNIDKDVEFMGNGSQLMAVKACNTHVVDVDSDEINNDDFDSGDDDDDLTSQRKKMIKELNQQEGESSISTTCFSVGQRFSTKEEFKDLFKLHAIESKRQLVLVRNDDRRLKGCCRGDVYEEDSVNEEQVLDGQKIPLNNKTENKKTENKKTDANSKKTTKKQATESSEPPKSWRKRELNLECPWEIYVSKEGRTETWQVKTFKDKHKCLLSRDIQQCTYDFIASKLVEKIPSNPHLPSKAVKVQIESEFEVNVSKQKAYRALKKAIQTVQGDYKEQYTHLREYLLELSKCNPDTSIHVMTEQSDPDLPTRVFKRVYVCLGPLKKGFQALGRDLLGLDGAFMKEPATGQVLTAVGVDSNNGIYPLAYAIVESENYNSWCWFLHNVGQDLGLHKRSNFTFISDRQKGLISAVENLYPCAEHRFCLRHLHQNMKKKWNGKAYKDFLWRCATATTVPQFEVAMQKLKQFNEGCWDYLAKIPPHHWARSHFSGRAKTDVLLNNMCEVLNRWLVDGRDKPIITALEFIREYLMKRIVNVHNKIAKCDGPLTPAATKVFEGIKKEASKYTVMFSGSRKYQVNGPHDDQCVVDMEQKSCVCRKWDLTGFPCKHVVAVLWNMCAYDKSVGSCESWVHPVHRLSTWKKTYQFTVNPLSGREHWPKSTVPTKLLPPMKIATAGRPKKNRRKELDEKETMVKNGKLSKKGGTTQCSRCKLFGHNKRGCPNGDASGSGVQKKKKRNA